MAKEPPFMPLQVGKAIAKVDLGIQGDNTGDNISAKNGSYCEMTGMYWAWKNLKDVDVIGLCHYRRYFDFYGQCRWMRNCDVFPTSKFAELNLDIPEKILSRIQKGTAVVAMPKHHMSSLALDYCYAHLSDDMRTLQQVVCDTQPEHVRRTYYDVMYNNNSLIHYNMFLMTWSDFDAYCHWIFPLLAEVEARTDISSYNPVQARIYGYMAERLFNVWLYAEHMHLIKRPLLWVRDEPLKRDPSAFTIIERNLRGWLINCLARGHGRDLTECL